MSANDVGSVSVLAAESTQEVALAQALTDRIKQEIVNSAATTSDVAAQLDMIEAAADQLMRTPRWSLPTAVRIASRLGLGVSFDVQREPAA